MTVSASFVEQIKELLSPLGSITVRRMFGGGGVYADGIILALVSDDVLHFKIDGTTQKDFEAEGCGPFTYDTVNGPHALSSYWRAPERLFDEPDEMVAWARKALAVSRAAQAKKKPAKRKSRVP